MKTFKTYKYKLYNRDYKELDEIVDLSSWIYNHCIALHRRYYKLFKKSLNKFKLQKHLVKLKQTERFKDWNKVPSQAVQDITDRIQRAYKLFCTNLKLGKKTSPPHFQKRTKYHSFTTKQSGYKLLDDNKIKVGSKIYSYFKSREVVGEIKTLTVKRTHRGYYIYLVVEQVQVVHKAVTTGKSVGFDFGMKTFLTASDGNDINIPQFLKLSLDKMKRLSKRFSKRKRGSRTSLNKLHEKVANQRKDLHWKLAHSLTDMYDLIVFETLDLTSMLKHCQKKINDFGFGNFLSILQYIAKQKRKVIHFVDKYFPSSKTCSECGWMNVDLKLSDRVFECQGCGLVHDRDYNASINIHREGTSSLNLIL